MSERLNKILDLAKERPELLSATETATLAAECGRLRALLIAFGKADIALEDSEDGQGCDNLIDAHANAYKALKAEAVRLCKEASK